MKNEHHHSSSTNLEDVKVFMVEKGWCEHQCRKCGITFFSKPSARIDTSVCGWNKCDNGDYLFLNFPTSKKLLKPVQINEKMRGHFQTQGFSLEAPRNIANIDGQTDLVIAGCKCLTTLFITTVRFELIQCLWNNLV